VSPDTVLRTDAFPFLLLGIEKRPTTPRADPSRSHRSHWFIADPQGSKSSSAFVWSPKLGRASGRPRAPHCGGARALRAAAWHRRAWAESPYAQERTQSLKSCNRHVDPHQRGLLMRCFKKTQSPSPSTGKSLKNIYLACVRTSVGCNYARWSAKLACLSVGRATSRVPKLPRDFFTTRSFCRHSGLRES
jgi:hypothetical protein